MNENDIQEDGAAAFAKYLELNRALKVLEYVHHKTQLKII